MGWARLLKRVFNIDLEHCPQCGSELKIIAAIGKPAVIVRILTPYGCKLGNYRSRGSSGLGGIAVECHERLGRPPALHYRKVA